jgi:hypothetical protein
VPSLWPRLSGITIQMIIAVQTMDRSKIWSFPRQPILTKANDGGPNTFYWLRITTPTSSSLTQRCMGTRSRVHHALADWAAGDTMSFDDRRIDI